MSSEWQWFGILMAHTWELFNHPITLITWDTTPLQILLFLLVLTLLIEMVIGLAAIADPDRKEKF